MELMLHKKSNPHPKTKDPEQDLLNQYLLFVVNLFVGKYGISALHKWYHFEKTHTDVIERWVIRANEMN